MIDERHDDGVTWVTFDRPDRLNSFTADDYRDLRLALDRLRADPATRVVVLTGRGRAFSAGADRSLLSGTAGDDETHGAAEEFDRLVASLAEFDKPLFAAVNGLAVGIGATMLLYCDVVIAAQSARFRLPFTNLGLVPEAGSSVLLPSRMRWADVMWWVLSSEWFDADEAARAGLVWRVVADQDLAAVASDAAQRVLTTGRAGLVKAALARELDEMSRLFQRDR